MRIVALTQAQTGVILNPLHQVIEMNGRMGNSLSGPSGLSWPDP